MSAHCLKCIVSDAKTEFDFRRLQAIQNVVLTADSIIEIFVGENELVM